MINSIDLSNYKAFDSVLIPIKPITIFLGANSVGKSSIIQMLMLMHQTAESKGNSYASALKIYGNYVNAGAYENLFTGKDISKPLGLSMTIDSDDFIDYLKRRKSELINIFVQLAMYSNFCDIDKIAEFSIRLSSRDEFNASIPKLLKHIREQKDGTLSLMIGHVLGDFSSPFKQSAFNMDEEDVLASYNFVDDLINESSRILKVSYEMIVQSDQLKIKSLEIRAKSTILRIEETSIESDYFLAVRLNKRTIRKCFNSNSTIFECFEDKDLEKNKTSLTYTLQQVIVEVLSRFCKCCSGNHMNYVSPLRAHPKRYYMLDKANVTMSLNTLDGDEITEVLKENKTIKRDVNAWFDKFGFKVDVNQFKEVVHNLNVTQNGLKLDITDVGFGISQVLPIIIQGFLSPSESVTIVEQPEIHLHPKMQADLGDLFIDIVQKRSKKLIVETHSEYLLRRIRRRIAEGKISSTDVSICLFHPRTKKEPARVEVLEIGEKGSFQWPEEFYGGELLADTLAFLKQQ